jgi:hypothetical protein
MNMPKRLYNAYSKMFDAIYDFAGECKKDCVLPPDSALAMIVASFLSVFDKKEVNMEWKRNLIVQAVNEALTRLEEQEKDEQNSIQRGKRSD